MYPCVGFFLPLSGGADSSATAAIVGSMCQLVYKAAVKGCDMCMYMLTGLMSYARNQTCALWRAMDTLHILHHSRAHTYVGDPMVRSDLRRLMLAGGARQGEWESSTYMPASPREIANRLFYSCYMGE